MPDDNRTEMKGVWAVLKEIKDELKDIDDKWERHIEQAGGDRQKLDNIGVTVSHIEQILVRGNGQKPVLAQLEGLHHDVEALKESQRTGAKLELSDDEAKKAESDASKAKWLAVAKIAGILALALPGIMALFGLGG